MLGFLLRVIPQKIKKARNSVPNHFAEAKITWNFVILFRTIQREIKMLGILFQTNSPFRRRENYLELSNFVPNRSKEDKNAQNSVLNYSQKRKTLGILFETITGKKNF
jgi:hypothetical protein